LPLREFAEECANLLRPERPKDNHPIPGDDDEHEDMRGRIRQHLSGCQ
jgi:hypothetical protein